MLSASMSTTYPSKVHRRDLEHARSSFFDGPVTARDRLKEISPAEKTVEKTFLSTNCDDFIGYSNLPNQIYRKAVRKGFVLNLMIVGESGLGKSTFVNSFLSGKFYGEICTPPKERIGKTLEICSHTALLKENGINLKLTLVDTPGFGDAIDNSNSWRKIISNIDQRFDSFMKNENRIQRSHTEINDERIHACLYFISPTGHSLKELDIEFLRKVQEKVNIILIIGKADTLTKEECDRFKKNILASLRESKINLYEFPLLDESLQGENERRAFKNGMERIGPFAVIGASTMVTNSKGVKVLARVYPWGHVEIENTEFSDFILLRELLLGVHTQSLIDNTNHVHYSLYRKSRLMDVVKASDFGDGEDPMLILDKEKKESMEKMKKVQASLDAVFQEKQEDRCQKLEQYKLKRQKEIEELESEVLAEEMELERRRKQFEAERSAAEEAWAEADIDVPFVPLTVGNSIPSSQYNTFSGLGDRLLSEVLKEKPKTEKKRRGLF